MTFEEEPDQEERIKKLRAKVKKIGGSELLDNLPADLSVDAEERFLKNVVRFHDTEPTTVLQLLVNAGFEFVAPDQLDDETIAVKLKETTERIGTYGIYLRHTDHLSDRELYKFLAKCFTE